MTFNSIFDDASNKDVSFDTIFGAQEDDDLMNIVAGFDESGDVKPLPGEDDDISDNNDPGPDHDSDNKPTDDSSNKDSIGEDLNMDMAAGEKSDAGNFYDDEDKKYQDGNSDNNGNTIDPEHIEDAVDEVYSLLSESDDEKKEGKDGKNDETDDNMDDASGNISDTREVNIKGDHITVKVDTSENASDDESLGEVYSLLSEGDEDVDDQDFGDEPSEQDDVQESFSLFGENSCGDDIEDEDAVDEVYSLLSESDDEDGDLIDTANKQKANSSGNIDGYPIESDEDDLINMVAGDN